MCLFSDLRSIAYHMSILFFKTFLLFSDMNFVELVLFIIQHHKNIISLTKTSFYCFILLTAVIGSGLAGIFLAKIPQLFSGSASKNKFSADANFPDLTEHNNVMAEVLRSNRNVGTFMYTINVPHYVF